MAADRAEEATEIEFKGIRSSAEFERFMRQVICQSGLGRTVFVYVEDQVNGGHLTAEVVLLRGVVGNRVAFKAQGRSNDSCFRGTIFVSRGTADEALSTLSVLDCAKVNDPDDLTDKAEDLVVYAKERGEPLTGKEVFEMLALQALQNFAYGKVTPVRQLRAIIHGMGIHTRTNELARKFSDLFLRQVPGGYVPTKKLAQNYAQANLFSRLQLDHVVVSLLQQYAKVTEEIEELSSSDARQRLAESEEQVDALRVQLRQQEETSARLRTQLAQEMARQEELASMKDVLMEFMGTKPEG